MEPYSEAEYAQAKLGGTIVRYGNIPVTVLSVSQDGTVIYSVLGSEEHGQCKLKQLDINPVPLGYANLNKSVLYICRRPMRQDWRQGLRKQNMTCPENISINVQPGTLHNVIKGIYPSYDECVEKLGHYTSVQGIAFNREFAIRRLPEIPDFRLEYKGFLTCGGVAKNGRIDLFEPYFWLDEVLTLAVNAAKNGNKATLY